MCDNCGERSATHHWPDSYVGETFLCCACNKCQSDDEHEEI